ncbi:MULTISPECIES: cell wall metabolism sensor histidine kinase WalK [Heyndrickxia]|jgi:two-component system sensor histidine kinase VicK|uniref:histidine kinase n=1 Tax=Heyndrickxia oleronia TaxID=38875 RepID=A0A8E2IE70_9BACI|nr:cell wall metabolism sensor histidine kinase WalK [Heyndrickxia oleronia]NYV66350.1 cell wall metabolism sensor histidine kinase WalK [Bacillus sp. Gen3]OJH19856.1 cell wall metabolism sensor histidine kinase WalK [Bacillus obstructivus]MCI1590267.1 cell wall metabolism sensor histidine kinase WalK [Heyndrickxia oleronia]MCI1614049.1 cell wall metabolism sensor histidine kinase WalK [Heyndrickxia oleronia]MCI1744298.1 cell wall metabolism sensor histidine kinase WalK [Heyndrickxia oleronia]
MKKVGFFQSIHLKFVLIFILLILISMEIIGVYFVNKLEEKLQQNFTSSIEGRVKSLEYLIREAMKSDNNTNEDMSSKIHKILSDNETNDIEEIRLIDSNGVILGTSDSSNQSVTGQRVTDINIKRALVSGKKWDRRFIDKAGKRIWVLVNPIQLNSNDTGYIYIVGKIESVYKEINEINKIFTTGTAIAMVITAMLGIVLAQTITRPIADMRRQAMAMAKGNFSRKVKVYGNDEIGQLAYSFNHMTKKLQEAQATTEGERRKLDSILAHMTDGVIATDRKGKIILINNPAAEMLDVSRETVLSQELVSLLNIEDLHQFEDLLKEQDSIILDFSTKEEPYILRASFSIIQSETGFVSGLITVLHDVTEQEKIDMERREFVSNVSHELRTPLTTMRSYLEALAEGAIDDKEIAPRFLTVTQNETERMIRLVNDLLKLSKMDSRDYQLNKEWVNIIEYFHHVIDRFEMAKDQNVTFKRKLPNAGVFVEVDLDKLTQVLDNIISNALKYSPEGGQITFRARELEEMVELSISDQGMGIPKDNLKKIFERFYRVDKARTRKMGGSGLGLAIAKEMVEAHGGEIWARSEEGKGTTIYLTLPYDRTQEDDWS